MVVSYLGITLKTVDILSRRSLPRVRLTGPQTRTAVRLQRLGSPSRNFQSDCTNRERMPSDGHPRLHLNRWGSVATCGPITVTKPRRTLPCRNKVRNRNERTNVLEHCLRYSVILAIVLFWTNVHV